MSTRSFLKKSHGKIKFHSKERSPLYGLVRNLVPVSIGFGFDFRTNFIEIAIFDFGLFLDFPFKALLSIGFTLFGILFVAALKIFVVRPYRNHLLVKQAEEKRHEP